MALLFPGMNPYLEQPGFWPSFHSRLIVAMADVIDAVLSPEYYVEVETRTYLDDGSDDLLISIPDAVFISLPAVQATGGSSDRTNGATAVQLQPQRVVVPMPEEVNERYLEIRNLATGDVITAIEVLSPKNKQSGPGREVYLNKRNRVIGSLTHLVELDLLRGGTPVPLAGAVTPTPYRILVSPREQRPQADLYGVTLQMPLPTIPIPLKPGTPEVLLPLQAVFEGVFSRGRYQGRIDYTQAPPPPKLSPVDQAWLNQQLSASGLQLGQPESD
ncbi:MAG: DUF4058 family protein [Nodosilinea sp.]